MDMGKNSALSLHYAPVVFFMARQLQRAKASSLTRIYDHTQTHHTLSRTPLDE